MHHLLSRLARIFRKPTKCPNCGNEYFYWDHEGPRGEEYWKCGKCGFMIKT